jgi:hypothetical protein
MDEDTPEKQVWNEVRAMFFDDNSPGYDALMAQDPARSHALFAAVTLS